MVDRGPDISADLNRRGHRSVGGRAASAVLAPSAQVTVEPQVSVGRGHSSEGRAAVSTVTYRTWADCACEPQVGLSHQGRRSAAKRTTDGIVACRRRR